MLIFAFVLALAATEPAQPSALSEIHQRDIACVAVMALHADDQKRKEPGYDEFPDVQARGKKWAGIVGERVMRETGQPLEVVGFAMKEAGLAERLRVGGADEPRAVIYERFNDCLPLMEADLAANGGVDEIDRLKIDWDSDEPRQILARKAELKLDLQDPARVYICRQTLLPLRDDLIKNEGANSVDAVAMTRTISGLDRLSAKLGLANPAKLAKYQADIANSASEWDREALLTRCLILGSAADQTYPAGG